MRLKRRGKDVRGWVAWWFIQARVGQRDRATPSQRNPTKPLWLADQILLNRLWALAGGDRRFISEFRVRPWITCASNPISFVWLRINSKDKSS